MLTSSARRGALLLAVGLIALVAAACIPPDTGGGGTTTTLPSDPAVVQVAGSAHSCGLINDGSVYCWGSNAYGQLGDGTTTLSAVPVKVVGVEDAVEIAVGLYFTCARLEGGSVTCWGRNNLGQLGDGTGVDSPSPVAVSGITTATRLDGSNGTACVLLADTTVQCWGSGRYGQLGNGTPEPNPNAPTPGAVEDANNFVTSPVAVTGLSGAVKLSVGASNACVVMPGGTIKCWGRNFSGELGAGLGGQTMNPSGGHPYSVAMGNETTNQTLPVDVLHIDDAVDVSAGGGSACAILSDGTVKCWGRNGGGELGIGSVDIGTSTDQPTTAVEGITNAVSVEGGSSRCAVLADGELRCWGDNFSGQAGSGVAGGSIGSPVSVAGIAGAVSVAPAGQSTCVALGVNGAACWGQASSGKLGNGTTSPNQLNPVAVLGLPTT